MNEKKAKRLRQYLRDCGVAVGGVRYKQYWPLLLAEDCGRARYQSLKKVLVKTGRFPIPARRVAA